MVRSSSTAKTDLKPGIYIGGAVSTLLLLLPYVNLVFIPRGAGELLLICGETWSGERRIVNRRLTEDEYEYD
jgi:hypothetical protein